MHGTLRVHSERGHDQVGLAVHQLADQPVPLLFGAVHLEGKETVSLSVVTMISFVKHRLLTYFHHF